MTKIFSIMDDFVFDDPLPMQGTGSFKEFDDKARAMENKPFTSKHYDVLVIDDLGPPTAEYLNQYTGKFVMQGRPVTATDLLKQCKEYAKSPLLATPKPTPTMTRLTSYNDWTILLEGDKLVAVNSTGLTVRAVGKLLSAGGRAWMYVNGQLWSGELERHETEKEVREFAKAEARAKVAAKHEKKLTTLSNKYTAASAARDEALRSL